MSEPTPALRRITGWAERSNEVDKILPVLLKVQQEIKPVHKGGYNPHYKSNFANINSIWEEIKPLLNKNKLTLTYTQTFPFGVSSNESVYVKAVLVHSSGQYISSITGGPLDKKTPQAIGIYCTYLSRYSTCLLLALEQTDDDAEGAMTRDAGTDNAKKAPAKKAAAKKQIGTGTVPGKKAPSKLSGKSDDTPAEPTDKAKKKSRLL